MLLPLVRPDPAAVVVLNSEKLYTLRLGTMQFQGQYGTEWSRVLAFISLALVPAIAFYLVAECHLVSGLTAGCHQGMKRTEFIELPLMPRKV